MLVWGVLIGFILLLLAFDMLVLHKNNKEVNNKKAAVETVFWVSTAMLFALAVGVIYKHHWVANPTNILPAEAISKYLSGYLIELSLSVDNLFVIAMIFTAFNIPVKYQHRALFWGILGAIIFRGIMIGIGVILVNRISWMTYVFGAFLLYTALKMLFKKDEAEESNFRKKLSKWLKISNEVESDHFWTTNNGVKMATPLFAALIMIELTDLLFALDSIPAILAVTTDPFIVFSSNIFAILGLRSMYFFLANMLQKFHLLKYSVVTILIYVSVKLLLIHTPIHFPEWFSLSFIAFCLLSGVFFSIYRVKYNVLRIKK